MYKVGVQSEHRIVQSVSLVGLHALNTGQQNLLEQLWIKIRYGKFKQAASYGPRCGV